MANPVLAHQVMMAKFKTVDGVLKISDALKLMKEEGLSVVLVEPRDDSDVHGILTLRDIARKVIGERRKLHEAHVYEIMSKPVLSVTSSMPIPYAARLLTNFNVSYAMVMDADQVIGILSLKSIVTQWTEDMP